ncbi:Bax inhibitor-1/YccA family protein [Aurantibacillus circumpalustris]|uniref:Bax inhibitor-1/YccA family protein n=1 Tax=Aurantibacillus circumpalustris TaxID=3036359 RepID=UPI00295B764E|nr:Bax inhibitor-1/YccA family protein [Aurantibacillus circumpalustris]
MENLRSTDINKIEYTTIAGENKLLRNSFAWMALAMLLTAIAALVFANVPELTSILLEETETGFKPTIFAYIVMFAPLLFVLGINFGLSKLSYPALIGLFIAYSIINGISFSFIFFIYAIGSIITVFFSTTALFALMAIAGYTTKTDLTKMGSILMIGVVGIVIASLINMFMGSAQMDYIISILGVIIFTGLTAYDVQKIKNLGQQVNGDSTLANKLGIIGALTLYLDFINLFLFLLRLFGGRKD